MSIVAASDGVPLAVHRYSEFDPGRPSVLAVHGYPDNHRIWDGVAEKLVPRYNVAAYDVRGAGESGCPASRSGYALEQLVTDLDSVIDSLGVGQVHLLAHDWGSVQGWAAVSDRRLARKIASFTSISGPHLPAAGRFLRSVRTPRSAAEVAGQVMSSGYLGLLLCPRVPELAFRSGLGVKVVEAAERIGQTSTLSRRVRPPRAIGDYVNGLSLYRENLPGPLVSPGDGLPEIEVAVQVLVPGKDVFIKPPLQRYIGAIPQGGRVIPIQGGHWVVTSRPDVVARLTGEWIDQAVEGDSPRGASVVRGGPREVRGKLALVTGAGAGLGRAAAVELARHGARAVVIVDPDLAAANETADAVRAACAAVAVHRVDSTDDDAINDLAARVRDEHGVIDILVNNAEIGRAGWWGTSRAFGAQMVERGEGGTIINVAADAAYLPSTSISPSTTTAAVLNDSKSLRAEFAEEGITVTVVRLGTASADIAKSAKAIVKAVRTGAPVVPVAAESRLGHAMRRISVRTQK